MLMRLGTSVTFLVLLLSMTLLVSWPIGVLAQDARRELPAVTVEQPGRSLIVKYTHMFDLF
jgi:hypothetical protein